jgi:succinate dehydrogenase/fumarate reductase flavoprotein subunit
MTDIASGELPAEADVVVVGSGGAGLTAALAAAAGGAEVAVLEASERWGGTTALSGAQVWVPVNHRMAAGGWTDSAEDALTYIRDQAPGRDHALIEAFVAAAPAMARFVEDHSPLELAPCRIPDSFAERPGGRDGGRHLEPRPVAVGDLGPADALVWPASYPMVLTNEEIADLDLIGGGQLPMDLIARRSEAGEVCMGQGLVVGLLRGCRDAGVALVRGCRVERLELDAGGVTGVEARCGGAVHRVGARRGVVLAGGGFEWDPGLVARFQGATVARSVSPPVNRGDSLRLAASAGAELARTGESWFWPVASVDGETWPDGSPRPRLMMAERTRPHAIWVNAAGRRFVDEASHNCALALTEVDPATNRPRNQPAWAVGDAQFRARYPLTDGYTEAATLAELASLCGIDAAGLETTVERFNAMARAGLDDDFGRGGTLYDRHMGDPSATHPNLGTVEEPPFFALPVHLGTVGSKGGPRTDAQARVLSWSREPIPGLYAAGNAMAAPIGPGTIAPGLTLGLALTFGWIAGSTAAAAT